MMRTLGREKRLAINIVGVAGVFGDSVSLALPLERKRHIMRLKARAPRFTERQSRSIVHQKEIALTVGIVLLTA